MFLMRLPSPEIIPRRGWKRSGSDKPTAGSTPCDQFGDSRGEHLLVHVVLFLPQPGHCIAFAQHLAGLVRQINTDPAPPLEHRTNLGGAHRGRVRATCSLGEMDGQRVPLLGGDDPRAALPPKTSPFPVTFAPQFAALLPPGLTWLDRA